MSRNRSHWKWKMGEVVMKMVKKTRTRKRIPQESWWLLPMMKLVNLQFSRFCRWLNFHQLLLTRDLQEVSRGFFSLWTEKGMTEWDDRMEWQNGMTDCKWCRLWCNCKKCFNKWTLLYALIRGFILLFVVAFGCFQTEVDKSMARLPHNTDTPKMTLNTLNIVVCELSCQINGSSWSSDWIVLRSWKRLWQLFAGKFMQSILTMVSMALLVSSWRQKIWEWSWSLNSGQVMITHFSLTMVPWFPEVMFVRVCRKSWYLEVDTTILSLFYLSLYIVKIPL